MKVCIRAAALVFTAVLSLLLLGCAKTPQPQSANDNTADSAVLDTSAQDIKDSGKLIAAVAPDFFPFEYKNEEELLGIDIDIAKKIAEELGAELEIVQTDFSTLLSKVDKGECNIAISALSITQERSTDVDFSDAYYKTSQAVIVPRDSKIQTAKDLSGKTAAVPENSSGKTFCEDMECNTQEYKSGAEAVVALCAGKTDVCVIDVCAARVLISGNDDLRLLEGDFPTEEYAVAVKKGNNSLKEVVNAVLNRIRSDGTLAEIFAKYNVDFNG